MSDKKKTKAQELLEKAKARKAAKEAREAAKKKDAKIKKKKGGGTPITDKADLTASASDLIKEHLSKGNIKAVKMDAEASRHYLMWVGNDHYPTIQHFVQESRKMGVSKRLNMVTPHLIPNVTRIYLAHNCWYETASQFLTTKDSMNRPNLVGGIEAPQISRMKSLRRLGMALIKAEVTDPQTIMDGIVNGHQGNHNNKVWRIYRDRLNYEATWRLFAGEEADPVLVPLVKKKAKAITDKTKGDSLHRTYKRSDWLTMKIVHTAAFMAVCVDYVNAIEAGKGVFGYFLLECLEYILPRGKKLPQYLDKKTINALDKRGKPMKDPRAQAILNLISKADGGFRDDKLPKVCRVVKEENEPSKHTAPGMRRGCGYRKADGVYAVSSKQARARGTSKGLGVAGPLYLAKRPVTAEGLDYYRGVRSIPEDIENVVALEMTLRGAKKSK